MINEKDKLTKEMKNDSLLLSAHMHKANAQHELVQLKTTKVFNSENLPCYLSTHALIMDYSESLDAPHLQKEQAGDDCYAPLSICDLGIVDARKSKTHAHAHEHAEAEGHKGINSVSSIIYCCAKD